MGDKPKPKIGAHWKRPPTRVYDYNYDVGQHYYKPMMKHLDKKNAGLSSELPGPKTFAERLAEDPLHGKSKPVNYVSSDYSPTGAGRMNEDGPTSRRPGARDPFSNLSTDDDFGQGDTDPFSRHRPSRLTMPSLSDQILDSAGLKTGDSFLDDALADMKSKRRPVSAQPQDLMNDPFFSQDPSRKEDTASRRRHMLQDINNDLEKVENSLAKFGRGKSTDDLALTTSASASASSASSLNVKKRSLKTTVTTETVRY